MPTKSYKIEWLERRTTTTSKAMIKATLEDETGAQLTDIGIWGDFPGFNDLMPGSTVQGSIVEKGQYKTLYPVKQPSQGTTGGQGGNMKGAAALQNKKFAQIDKSQDRKEFGIQVSSTMANSTAITIELLKGQDYSLEEYAATFERVRKWFIQQWNTTEQMIDVPFPDKTTPQI